MQTTTARTLIISASLPMSASSQIPKLISSGPTGSRRHDAVFFSAPALLRSASRSAMKPRRPKSWKALATLPVPLQLLPRLNGPIKPYVSADTGVSEWGYETLKQPTVRPPGLWPGDRKWTAHEASRLHRHQELPRPFLFRSGFVRRAALIRRWAGERFPVELGDWNLQPRGPHTTPSFYFGFTNDLLTVIVPWFSSIASASPFCYIPTPTIPVQIICITPCGSTARNL